MKTLEIGDVVKKVSVNIHTDRKEEVLYEYKIDGVTKRYAFSGYVKFDRDPIFLGNNSYNRRDGVDSQFIVYKISPI